MGVAGFSIFADVEKTFRGKHSSLDLFRQRRRRARRVPREATHARTRRPRECDRPFEPSLETPRACPAPRPGGRADMAPASRDEPDVPAEDARDDCRTNQPSPPGSGEGSVEEDTRARDAETTPDQATDAKPDEDDEARQVRGSARASRHDPFPEASRARLLLSFRDFQCRFFPGAVRFVEGARARSVSATRVGECRAPRVHGRARADPEKPPRAFPAFRADVRPLDAGSSEDAERLRPELFRTRFSRAGR